MITKYDVKTFLGSMLGFGKENAPAIMTGGSIILGWTAAYIFWKQGKKAQHTIDVREAEMNAKVADGENVLGRLKRPEEQLPKQEKISIYLSYCWLALALGLASTGLAVWGQKISLDRIGMGIMATQFFKDKAEKNEKTIKEQAGGEKQYEQAKHEQHHEEFPPEEICKNADNIPGEGRTIFVDLHTGASWKNEVENVVNGLAHCDAKLQDKYNKKLEEYRKSKNKKFGNGAFDVANETPYGSDSPFFDDDPNIYSEIPMDDLLYEIGEIKHKKFLRCGESLCFRFYGLNGKDKQYLKPKLILDYDDYVDPATGVPLVCYVDYEDFLSPTFALIERNPV